MTYAEVADIQILLVLQTSCDSLSARLLCWVFCFMFCRFNALPFNFYFDFIFLMPWAASLPNLCKNCELGCLIDGGLCPIFCKQRIFSVNFIIELFKILMFIRRSLLWIHRLVIQKCNRGYNMNILTYNDSVRVDHEYF